MLAVVAVANQATTNFYGQVSETASSGTGFIISPDGYVITNYHTPETTEVRLHRLYIKAAKKRQGIGTRLLHTVEAYLAEHGKTAAHVHLGGKEYFESRSFYPKHGYQAYAHRMMKKEL